MIETTWQRSTTRKKPTEQTQTHQPKPGPGPHPNNWLGQRVGAYLLCRVLGEGKAGIYLGEQQDIPSSKAAVKLPPAGASNHQCARKFLEERQILARLHHPNITRLLDDGNTDDGRPYLVTEYVDGLAIDQFSREKQLTLYQRLALFLKLCEAVDYVHRGGIIHCNLKPSNILVTHAGEPILLNFSNAQDLNQIGELEKHANQYDNSPARTAMAAEYTSPEQFSGQKLTPLWDIYALGCLLYEMVTGRTPHRFDAGSVSDHQRIITDSKPAKPSQWFQTNHLFNPGNWADLDAIILKAIASKPEQRYQSALSLAMDLRRFLAEEPVQAQIRTRYQRLPKVVRRHRWTLLTGLGFLALCLFAWVQQVELKASRQLASERLTTTMLARHEARASRALGLTTQQQKEQLEIEINKLKHMVKENRGRTRPARFLPGNSPNDGFGNTLALQNETQGAWPEMGAFERSNQTEERGVLTKPKSPNRLAYSIDYPTTMANNGPANPTFNQVRNNVSHQNTGTPALPGSNPDQAALENGLPARGQNNPAMTMHHWRPFPGHHPPFPGHHPPFPGYYPPPYPPPGAWLHGQAMSASQGSPTAPGQQPNYPPSPGLDGCSKQNQADQTRPTHGKNGAPAPR